MLKYIGIFLLWIISCLCQAQDMKNIKGSGYILTQQRETAYFNSIHVSCNISVYIVPGEFQPLTIEADDNLFPYIKTVVRNKILKIYIPDTINIVKFTHMNILVSLPEITVLQARQNSLIDAAPQLWKVENIILKASTGSRIHLAVHASDVKIHAKTSANIELKGKTQNLDAELSTAARLYARNFEADAAILELGTGAKAEIRVNEKISYDLIGNSKLIYKGNPEITKKSVNSGSRVIHDR